MTRGRLAIFSPDGPVDHYYIESEVVAIGRSSGNDLVLDRHGISRYHISLTVQDKTAEIRDLESVNGTYVDGLRLQPNEARVLRGGEEIQIGDSRLIYYPPSDNTLDDTVMTQVTSLESRYLAVEMEGPNIPITPGVSGPATLNLKNISDEPLRIHIAVEGIPATWVRIDRTEFTLPAEKDIDVSVTFKPSRRPESKPGRYDILVTLSFPETNHAPIAINSHVDIMPYSGYGVVNGTPLIESGEPFQIYIHNQGNSALPLEFWGEDKNRHLIFDISPPHITLNPGERSVISGTVKPKRRRLVGQNELYEYVILSKSLSPAGFLAPVSGKIRLTPRISQWIAPALLSVPLFFLAILLLVLSNNSPEPENTAIDVNAPVISAFAINGLQSALVTTSDTPLIAAWQVRDTERLDFVATDSFGNTVLQQTLEGRADGRFIFYLPSQGVYNVHISARNADKATQAQPISVTIRPDYAITATVQIGQDETLYTSLYRNVVGQRLVVEWMLSSQETSDAGSQLAINSTDNPELDHQIVAGTEPSYTTAVSPLNIGAVELTIGNEETMHAYEVLPIQYPTCVTLIAVDVHTASQGSSPVLVQLSASETVMLDGSNEIGDWMRIILPASAQNIGYYGWVPVDALMNANCVVAPTQLGRILN